MGNAMVRKLSSAGIQLSEPIYRRKISPDLPKRRNFRVGKRETEKTTEGQLDHPDW